jgi:hypothetical protein
LILANALDDVMAAYGDVGETEEAGVREVSAKLIVEAYNQGVRDEDVRRAREGRAHRGALPQDYATSGSARVTGHAASYWIYRPLSLARNGVAHSMHFGLRRGASVGPLNGNVFGPAFGVWASVVVRGRSAHGQSLAESTASQGVPAVEHPFHGMFF